MLWLRRVTIALLTMIGSLLVNLLSAMIGTWLGGTFAILLGTLLTFIVLVIALAAFIEPLPIESDPRQSEDELVRLRYDLYKLKEIHKSRVDWTPPGLARWREIQAEIEKTKDRLRKQGKRVSDQVIDYTSPTPGRFQGIGEFVKGRAFLFALPILVALASVLSPTIQNGYREYIFSPAPTMTPVMTPSNTPTLPPMDTATPTPTSTSTGTSTYTPTDTPTWTRTPTPILARTATVILTGTPPIKDGKGPSVTQASPVRTPSP